MKLYYAPGACSLSPHIALREAGLPVTLAKVDLKAKTVEGGEDFNQVNPKGYVPALRLDNGQVMTEGPAIVQYIADQKPSAKLAPPAGTVERYRLQEWLNFISSEIHKPMGSMFNPAQTPDWKEAMRANLGKRLDWLEPQLAKRDHLMADGFTVADGYLFVVLGWAPHVGFELAPWTAVGRFIERVGKRPAVAEAMKAEGLVK
jgi:glutathione S-transferase